MYYELFGAGEKFSPLVPKLKYEKYIIHRL
jgi:hypothetical protein